MEIKDGLNVKDEKIHAFLMIGQSNMAGRGEFDEVEPIKNPGCFMLRMGRWQTMSEPVNPDRYIFLSEGDFHSGISLAPAFADRMARDEGIKVGLIPCADGGTRISQWMPGEVLFDHAVMMAKLAQRTSVIDGILWHQGESDTNNDADVEAYKAKFIKMISALRAELGDLPVVIGELPWEIGEKWHKRERVPRMNEILHELAHEVPNCAIASSKGLTMKPDGIHFDSRSLRVFGNRYYECYKALKSSESEK